MQCQAVPLIKTEAPVVGTGMEGVVASAMGRTVKAWHGGEVDYVDGNKVVIKVDKKELKKVDKEGIAVVQNLLIDFWETLQAAIKSGNFLPTGLSHDYACNFCGYGKSGKCPYYKLKS
jgi:hypothetical protein